MTNLRSFEIASEAEIIRAKGVAKANMIIGESLKNNGSYLRYLWIQTLNDNPQNVIYVPTEAGLPILEAGKRADIRYDNMQTEFNVEMQEFEQY